MAGRLARLVDMKTGVILQNIISGVFGVGRARATAVALALGAAVLAGIRVSTLPNDLVFMLPAVAVVWAGVFMALRTRRDASQLTRWVAVPCWLWLLALAANPFYSAWPEMSIWFALIFALIPASILGLHHLLAEDQVWNRLEWLLFGAAALVAVAMLFEYFALGLRSNGPFLDANVASAVLYAVLLPLLYRLLAGTDRGPTRWLLAGLALLLSAGLFTSFSRGGVGSFEIALVGTALVVLVMARRAVACRFAGCLALVAVGYALVYYGPQQPFERSLDNLPQDNSLQARFMMWGATLDIYADAPVLGHGLGTYKLMYPRYRSRHEAGTTGDMAHNDYLQVLAGGGPLMLALLAGFVLLVLYVGLWLLWCVRKTRAGPNRLALLRDLGLCAALLALAVHATVNFIFYVLLLSLLTGLYAARLAGRYAVTQRAAEDSRVVTVLRRSARPAFGVAALVSLVTMGTAIVTSKTLHPAKEDVASVATPDYQLALAVSYINPLDYRAQYYVAYSEAILADNLGPGGLGMGMAVTALNDMRRLLAAKRPDCSAQTGKAILLEAFRPKAEQLRQKGLWQDPVALLHRVLGANPTCMAAWVALAKHWQAKGELERAIAVLEQAETWVHIHTIEREAGAAMLVTLADFTAQAGKPTRAVAILDYVRSVAPAFEPAKTLLAELQRPGWPD